MDETQRHDGGMTAPRLRELIGFGHHGYEQESLWDPGDLELFDRIEAEFSRLPFCVNGEVRALWVSVPRGSEEDYLSMCGDDWESTEEEILDEFRWDYPEEEEWYVITQYHTRHGKRGVAIDGLELCATPDSMIRRGFGTRAELLGWILDVTRGTVDSVEDGTYRDRVLRDLPLGYRRGVVRRSDLWESGYQTREDVAEGLTDDEVEGFRAIVSEGLGEGPSGTVPSLTLSHFLEAASLCFTVQGRDTDGMTVHEQYRRYSDGRYDGLLDLDPDDPDEFSGFTSRSHDGHTWEVLPGGGFTRMHLYPCHSDTGWYLELSGPTWRAEFVRSALALHGAGFPLHVYEAAEVLASLDGTDWVGIVPRGGTVAYQSHHYERHGVLDCILYTDELVEKVGDRIEWYDVNTFYPVDGDDGVA